MNISRILEIYTQYEGMLPNGWYPIGHDDEEFLFINSNEVKENSSDCKYLYWSSLIDLDQNDPTVLRSNFELWLDRLILSQGNKFWEW